MDSSAYINLLPSKIINDSQSVHLSTGDPDFNLKCSEEAKNNDILVSFDPGQDLGMYDAKKLKDVIDEVGPIDVDKDAVWELRRMSMI